MNGKFTTLEPLQQAAVFFHALTLLNEDERKSHRPQSEEEREAFLGRAVESIAGNPEAVLQVTKMHANWLSEENVAHNKEFPHICQYLIEKSGRGQRLGKSNYMA